MNQLVMAWTVNIALTPEHRRRENPTIRAAE
jgi:hypothetical protein